jgi:hypothetical protein
VEVEMSCTAAHQCHEARDRVLCFECRRSERDRRRAELLAELPPPRPLSKPFGISLTQRQRAHRAIMLLNLRRTAVVRA